MGIRLPVAMRDYYLTAGRLGALNQAHNRLLPLDELRVEDSHLYFMEENQCVAYWGLPVERRTSNDPVVHQRSNHDDANWYSEKMSFSNFLIRMYDWQAGFAEAPAPPALIRRRS